MFIAFLILLVPKGYEIMVFHFFPDVDILCLLSCFINVSCYAFIIIIFQWINF